MKRKTLLFIFLGILLFNPISLAITIQLMGIGFQYVGGRREKEITFFSSIKPALSDYDSLWFSSGSSIQFNDWRRKPITIFDENNKKLLEIQPADLKQNKEYIITSDDRFIPTGKVFDSYSFQIEKNNSWIHFPDLKITLYNEDGSVLIGPYENEKLYQYYAYKNGAWQRYTWIVNGNSANSEAEKASFTADYYFGIPGGSYVREQKKLVANTFTVKSNKQYKKTPQKFLFTNNEYYWNLNIEYLGQKHKVNFVTVKDPSELVFYPIKL